MRPHGTSGTPGGTDPTPTSNSFLYFLHFATSIGPVTASPFSSICFTHKTKAFSASGWITICALFANKAVGVYAKGGHQLICRSPGSVPMSQLDYFGLTQICGNTCAQVPEPMGQVLVMI